MYLVIFKTFMGYSVRKFETLDKAKQVVEMLCKAGTKEVTLSQEIPMKVTVSVEF